MDEDLIKTIIANSLAAIKAKYVGANVSITNPVVLLECAQIVGEQYTAAVAAEEAAQTPPPPPPAP